MSVATHNILKLLSNLSSSADKIVEENASEFNAQRVSEWISIVKNKADRIVEESTTGEQSTEMPSLMSYFLRNRSQIGRRVSISSALTEIQRQHLHRKVRKSSIKKTPLRRKSNVGISMLGEENNTPKLKIPTTIIKKIGNTFSANVSGSNSSIEGKEQDSILKMEKNTQHSSKKRKSSSEVSGLQNFKKSKIQNLTPSEGEKSTKEKKQIKAKNSSLLNYANIKSSVGTTNASHAVLKENRTLQIKQDKALNNRKAIMALRQQKLQENKKAKEEKVKKSNEEHMKLEKQKPKLRKSGGLEKSVATPKSLLKKMGNETLMEKTSKKDSLGKSEKLGSSVKRLQLNKKKIGTHTPVVLKSKDKTPVKKNTKHETEKTLLNTTYITNGEPSTIYSSEQGKTLKKAKIDSNLGAIKYTSETQAQSHTKGTKTVKPLKKIELEKQLVNSPYTKPSVKKNSSESYSITPARSSFVSYDISEIRSDSEEEEQETNTKPIPSWATGVRLRNALLQQHHHPVDTDELFGNIVDLPDLAVIMGVKKKQYKQRSSSAIWNSSFS